MEEPWFVSGETSEKHLKGAWFHLTASVIHRETLSSSNWHEKSHFSLWRISLCRLCCFLCSKSICVMTGCSRCLRECAQLLVDTLEVLIKQDKKRDTKHVHAHTTGPANSNKMQWCDKRQEGGMGGGVHGVKGGVCKCVYIWVRQSEWKITCLLSSVSCTSCWNETKHAAVTMTS